MRIAETLLALAAVYLLVGLVFGVLFVAVGVRRVDPAAQGAPIGFRLAILPGSAALWPVCLLKWIRSRP